MAAKRRSQGLPTLPADQEEFQEGQGEDEQDIYTEDEKVSRATGREKRVRSVKPLIEFLTFYFGTLAILHILDKHGFLYEGRSAWRMLPPGVSFRSLVGVEMLENFPFVLLGVVLVYPLHLWRNLVKSCFVRLAANGAGLQPGSLKYAKFLEQAWLAVHYSAVSSLEIYTIMTTQDSLWPPMISEASREAILMPMSAVSKHHNLGMVRCTYLLQFTFYFLELATLFMDQASRSRTDAIVYAIHHLLTVFLISFSFLIPSQHVGLLVLFFHDVGDIFLPIAKCFVYAEEYARSAYSIRIVQVLEGLGIFFFICFLVSFAVLRLMLFPILIYLGVYEAAWWTREWPNPTLIGIVGESAQVEEDLLVVYLDNPARTARFYLTTALLLLLPLHVYWFRLALRVAFRALFGNYSDERSEDGDADRSMEISDELEVNHNRPHVVVRRWSNSKKED